MHQYRAMLLVTLLASGPAGQTAAQVTKPTPTTSRLPKPARITATQQPNGSIRVIWSAVEGAVSYTLVRSVPPTPVAAVALPNPSDTGYVDSDVKAGSYYYYMVKAVNESGLGGMNVAAPPVVATSTVSMTPDLAMESCTFVPANPTESDRIQLRVGWRNVGEAGAVVNAGDHEWRASLVAGGQTIGGGGASGTNYTVAPNATKWGGLTVVEPFSRPAGTYTGNASIDPQNKIAESNETNNTLPCTLTIGPATTFPDLVVTSATLNPANPTTTQAFSAQVTVKNQGTARAEFVAQSMGRKTIVSGGERAGSATIGPNAFEVLEPGQSKTYTLSPTSAGAQAGTNAWTITADPDNAVKESNETNNRTTITVTVTGVTVPPPDLAMESCAFTPAHPTEADRVLLSVRWRNVGGSNAVVNSGDHEWRATLSAGGQSIGGGGASGTSYTVAPNATRGGGLTVVQPGGKPVGTYTGTATVDPDNRIRESNESNNTIPCSLTIAPAPVKAERE